MFDKFIQKNWLKIINTVFKDYLWTQFFPPLKFANNSFDTKKHKEIYKSLWENNNIKSLYIHIPFCKTKCIYCHCYTSLEWNESYEKYINYLLKEIKITTSLIWKKINLNSIFIWGGTPNIIWNKLLEKLLKSINSNFNLSNLKQFNID